MPLAGDTIQAVVHLAHARTSAIQNAFHWLLTGTGSVSTVDLVDAINDQLEFAYVALETLMATGTTIPSTNITRLEWVTDHWETAEQLGETFTPFAGFGAADAGNILPPGVAGNARIHTAIPRHNGRKYFAPFTETNSDTDGDATAGLVLAQANALTYFDTDITLAAGLFATPIVLRRDIAGHTPIAYVSSAPAFTYQRRRKLGRGI